jgi:hypothetical protein
VQIGGLRVLLGRVGKSGVGVAWPEVFSSSLVEPAGDGTLLSEEVTGLRGRAGILGFVYGGAQDRGF